MSIPVEVTFRDMAPSEALRQNIVEHAERLERFADDILSCDVVVEPSERRHQQGNRYSVRVHLMLTGTTIDAGRTPGDDRSHEDPYIAARDAFDAARRQVEDFIRKRRGDVKRHEESPQA